MKYTLEDYNQNAVLKIHWTLLITLLYLLKHYLLAIIPFSYQIPLLGLIIRDAIPKNILDLAYQYSTLLLLFSCLPALLITITALKRRSRKAPQSPNFYRWSWQHGRILLLSSIILELILIGWYLGSGKKHFNEFILLIIYLDIMVIFFIARSQRVRDIFNQYPKTEEEEWQLSLTKNTLLAYQNYLDIELFTQYRAEALKKIETLSEEIWQQAQQENSIDAYQRYLDLPIAHKKHRYEANQRLEQLTAQLHQPINSD